MNISIVGLGKLGSPMAACFAAKGYRVIGVDVNETFVQKINAGKAPVVETGLQEMINKTEGRLSATTSVIEAVKQTDATFLIVPTPSEASGAFSMKFVLDAAQAVGEGIKHKSGKHLIVLTSTVMPGDTKGQLLPALEAASGKKCGVDFGLCYSPEFISLGSVIRDMLNPDFVLIGESDPASGELLASIYQKVTDNKPRVARMSFVNAELTKLALNTFVTTKISYANFLAQLCERLDGGNVDAVTSALGLDTRIGSKYLKGSVAYGGPCFPRDNIALCTLARSLGVPAPLPEATDAINNMMAGRLKKIVEACLPERGTIAILGVAYKPCTNVVERGQGLELAQALLGEGQSVVIYDPDAMQTAQAQLKGKVTFASSAREGIQQADVVVLCSPCREFSQLTASDFQRSGSPRTVLDCWRMLDRQSVGAVCQYLALGTDDLRPIHRETANQQTTLRVSTKGASAA